MIPLKGSGIFTFMLAIDQILTFIIIKRQILKNHKVGKEEKYRHVKGTEKKDSTINDLHDVCALQT